VPHFQLLLTERSRLPRGMAAGAKRSWRLSKALMRALWNTLDARTYTRAPYSYAPSRASQRVGLCNDIHCTDSPWTTGSRRSCLDEGPMLRSGNSPTLYAASTHCMWRICKTAAHGAVATMQATKPKAPPAKVTLMWVSDSASGLRSPDSQCTLKVIKSRSTMLKPGAVHNHEPLWLKPNQDIAASW